MGIPIQDSYCLEISKYSSSVKLIIIESRPIGERRVHMPGKEEMDLERFLINNLMKYFEKTETGFRDGEAVLREAVTRYFGGKDDCR
jgi:hypothetical protein